MYQKAQGKKFLSSQKIEISTFDVLGMMPSMEIQSSTLSQ